MLKPQAAPAKMFLNHDFDFAEATRILVETVRNCRRFVQITPTKVNLDQTMV